MPCHVPAASVPKNRRRPSPPTLPPPPRYLLDGEEIGLKELLAVNDLSSDVVVQIRKLPPGRTMAIGAAGSTLTRLPREVSP